jgi:heme oxygenase
VKSRTAEVHQRVEAGLNLLDAELTTRRLFAVSERLESFWAGTAESIDRWALADPEQADRLQWGRRRRAASPQVAGHTDPAPSIFATVTTAEVLGWMYVREGSTLGGAVIEAHARKLLGNCGLPSFAPYAEGPQPMWRDYLSAQREWMRGDGARVEQVAAAAVATFTALERWLSPLFLVPVMPDVVAAMSNDGN